MNIEAEQKRLAQERNRLQKLVKTIVCASCGKAFHTGRMVMFNIQCPECKHINSCKIYNLRDYDV